VVSDEEGRDGSTPSAPELPSESLSLDTTTRRDSVLNRVLHGWPRTPPTLDPALRRVQGIELLIVLAIFPLGSTYQAVVDLIERIQAGFSIPSHTIPPLRGAWLEFSFGSFVEILQLGSVFLVWYLLVRSDEGLGGINLGLRRWRMDLAFLLPIFIVVQWLPIVAGTHILSATNLHGFFLLPSSGPLPLSLLTSFQVIQGLVAGILEEIVILGYLVRRLEQRGFGIAAVVAIDVLVRVSYHLYYGWNVIPIACWALVSVLVYLRVRRLLPFIICHFVWDAAFPFRDFYHGAYHVMQIVAIVATLLALLLWGRWSPSDAEGVTLGDNHGSAGTFPVPGSPTVN
jgi:membrane protease YdiL (CAAX protease family)